MQHVTTPLEITAAAWRVVGFMMVTNLRVATVFGQAAIESNPFAISTRLKANLAAPKVNTKPKTSNSAPAQPKEASVKAAAGKAAAVTKQLAKPAAPKPKTAAAPTSKPTDLAEKPKRPRAPSMPEPVGATTGKKKNT